MKNYIGSLYTKENMKYIELLPEMDSLDIKNESGNSISNELDTILNVPETTAKNTNLIKTGDIINNEFNISGLHRYNITKNMKYVVSQDDNTIVRILPKTWSMGIDPITPSYGHNVVGTMSDALSLNGVHPTTAVLSNMQSFNGATWSSVAGSTNKTKYASVSGVRSNLLSIGGVHISLTDTVEKYNDNLWSTMSSLPIAINKHSSVGTVDNTLLTSGETINGTTDNTVSFNGITWSTNTTLNSPRHSASMNGIPTDAIIHGGVDIKVCDTSEKYNNNIWSISAGRMNLGRYALSSTGTTNGILSFTGDVGSSVSTITEEYNETWSILSNINNKRRYFGSVGTSDTAMVVLGDVLNSSTTEIFTKNNITLLTKIGTTVINNNDMLQIINDNVPYSKVWSIYTDTLTTSIESACCTRKRDDIYIIGGSGLSIESGTRKRDDSYIIGGSGLSSDSYSRYSSSSPFSFKMNNKIITQCPFPNIMRSNASSAVFNNLVYLFAGQSSYKSILTSFESFNDEAWTIKGNMPVIVDTCASVGGKSIVNMYSNIYNRCNSTAEYNETWKLSSDMNQYMDKMIVSGYSDDIIATLSGKKYGFIMNLQNIVENRKNDIWNIHSNSNILHYGGYISGASHNAILAKGIGSGGLTEELYNDTWVITNATYTESVLNNKNNAHGVSDGTANYMITFGGGDANYNVDILQDTNMDIVFGEMISNNILYEV